MEFIVLVAGFKALGTIVSGSHSCHTFLLFLHYSSAGFPFIISQCQKVPLVAPPPHHEEENRGVGNTGKIKGRAHHKRTETRIMEGKK